MSNSTGKKKGKKMNSYAKMCLIMAVGACIGAASAVCFLSSEDTMVNVLESLYGAVAGNLFAIVLAITVLTVLLCGVSYWKTEDLLKQIENCDEDDEEELECHFEMWSTFEMLVGQVPMFAALIFLGFIPRADGVLNTLGVVVPFIILALFSGIFQVITIKQMQKKDPSKKGDPSDFRFNKDWMASCDEAEKEIIYQASYKTFNFMKYILLAGLILALLAQFHWQAGVAPLIFMGTIYILMVVVYSVYAMKLQKSKLNN